MTKNLTIFIAVVCAVAAVFGFASARSARKALGQALSSNLTYSNQWAGAQATLAERDAAIQTLRVQAELAAKDLQAAGQSYTNLHGKLVEVRRAMEATHNDMQKKRQEIASLSSELDSERNEKIRAMQKISGLETELAARQADLLALRVEMQALQSRANHMATQYSELLNKWADPTLLEAQIRRVRQGSRGTALSGKAPLMLQRDGSVVLAR